MVEWLTKPTADTKPEPAMMSLPEPTAEPIVTLDPEHEGDSDKVSEPVTVFVHAGGSMEHEAMEESPVHTPDSVGEPILLFCHFAMLYIVCSCLYSLFYWFLGFH